MPGRQRGSGQSRSDSVDGSGSPSADDRARYLASQHGPAPAAARIRDRDRRQQRLRVGMAGCAKRRRVGASSTMRPRYITATRSRYAARRQVVGDEQIGRPRSLLQIISRLTTCACTDTSSAETGSSATMQVGLDRQRPGDADALPLPAGELVRIAIRHVGGQADLLEQLRARALGALAASRQAEDVASAPRRSRPTVMRGIERRVGILEDHLHLRAAYARSSAGDRPVISMPSNRTLAGGRARSAEQRLAGGDLPQPLSPTSPSVSPRATVNDTPSTARTITPCCPNRPPRNGKVLIQFVARRAAASGEPAQAPSVRHGPSSAMARQHAAHCAGALRTAAAPRGTVAPRSGSAARSDSPRRCRSAAPCPGSSAAALLPAGLSSRGMEAIRPRV